MTLHDAVVYLLDEFHLGDKVYDAREQAVSRDPSFPGDSWQHPYVLRFQMALDALERFRRDSCE